MDHIHSDVLHDFQHGSQYGCLHWSAGARVAQLGCPVHLVMILAPQGWGQAVDVFQAKRNPPIRNADQPGMAVLGQSLEQIGRMQGEIYVGAGGGVWLDRSGNSPYLLHSPELAAARWIHL